MDEHIVRDLIGFHLESKEAKNIEDMMRRLGETALTLIRRERIEPQSPMAFHVYSRVVKVMYKIGAAIEFFKHQKPQRALMIGDTLHDFEVAKAIGADCILLAWGHQDRERLEGTGCLVFNNISEVINAFKSGEIYDNN